MQKLASTLVDVQAQVDLNPHQVDAALFAFRSPLSKGAILADEVGLGKTIEAGLVISQKWAEKKRKILIIAPANLRKQWSQELMDKFFLPSIILEAKSFNDFSKKEQTNPFHRSEIVICSYQFARTKESNIQNVKWDLVVIDEAHRLRNVYKPTNKIAKAIKQSLESAPKILLTATPLQNSLMELYGLVSMIDDFAFGDSKSFRTQYGRVNGSGNEDQFSELKERLKPICKRTLRRQVLEYVNYTNRIALVEEFYPTEEQQRLYDLVSEYLQRENLHALPSSQRILMTLILRRLLASSTYAITGTFEALCSKLEKKVPGEETVESELADNFETYEELKDEWQEQEEENENENAPVYSNQDLINIKDELKSLREFEKLAKSIQKNSKGEKLITALSRGFAELNRIGAPSKAIIFTESKRTQEYLFRILDSSQYKGKLVLFNGSNNDQLSKEIYQAWLERFKGTDKCSGSRTADMRMDSEHQEIYVYWPNDSEEFSLKGDKKIFDILMVTENLIGNNVDIPQVLYNKYLRADLSVENVMKVYEEYAKDEDEFEWEGVRDSTEYIYGLIDGDKAVIDEKTYKYLKDVDASVKSKISFVQTNTRWSFFAFRGDSSKSSKWLLIDKSGKAHTDFSDISLKLQDYLSQSQEIVQRKWNQVDTNGEIRRLTRLLQTNEKDLLSWKKKRALQVGQKLLKHFYDLSLQKRGKKTVIHRLLSLYDPDKDSDEILDLDHFADLWLKILLPALDKKRERLKYRRRILTLRDLTPNDVYLSKKKLTELYENCRYASTLDELVAACIIAVPK